MHLEDIIQYLKVIISEKLGVEPENMKEEEAFFSYGITSLISEAIRTELLEKYEVLSSTVLFEYPNIRCLAEYLYTLDMREGEQIPILTSQKENSAGGEEIHKKEQEDMQIAVIGMAGRFPKASSVTQLWENIFHNKDCIEKIPKERWDYKRIYSDNREESNKISTKYGGFLEDIDKFDSLFFHISPKEAQLMDPQQKLFLLTCYETMEDAGYASADRRKDGNIGVFAGVTWNEFSLLAYEEELRSGEQKGGGSLYWGISNRVSYFLNLTGPSVAIDTACSSSLTAVHQACQAITSGDCEMALAGGVNLSLHPNKYLYLDNSRFLSPDGKCKSFGEGGDGYVVGEGVASVLLKPLEKAKEDGDYIYGVIRATAVNHGGKATGYTVPNPVAHKNLIQAAMKRAKIEPEAISYVECHGTGTNLGDPIEVNGLSKAFFQGIQKKQFCGIGSIKSNIGHLEAAAGVTGLIKVLLCMRNHILPASLHTAVTNPKIKFEETPFYVVRENQKWIPECAKTLIAGLSSFGAGGSNAHAIIESYEMKEEQIDVKVEEKWIPLSADSNTQLRSLAKSLSKYLTYIEGKEYEHEYTLSNIAGTLTVGREAFSCRVGFLVNTVTELIEKLNAFADGENKIHNVWSSDDADIPLECFDNFQKGKLVQWIYGQEKLEPDGAFHIVPLPTYPFRKERSWIHDEETLCPTFSMEKKREQRHPFFEKNESTVKHGVFTKNFSKEEFFLKDHLIYDQYVLPGVCHLEIALQGTQFWREEEVITLRDVWYSNPIVVSDVQEPVVYQFSMNGENVHYDIQKPDGEIYSRGEVVCGTRCNRIDEVLEPARIKKDLLSSLERGEVYRLFGTIQIFQKYSFQVVSQYYYNKQAAFAKLELPQQRKKEFSSFYLHPALLDGAVQTAMVHWIKEKNNGKLIVPFYFREIQVHMPFTETVYVYATYDEQDQYYNITIYNDNYRAAVTMKEFTVKEVEKESGFSTGTVLDVLDKKVSQMMYHPVWKKKVYKSSVSSNVKSIGIIYREEADEIKEAIAMQYPDAEIFYIQIGTITEQLTEHTWNINYEDSQAFENVIKEMHKADEIYFLGAIGKPYNREMISVLEEEQKYGLIQLYRLLRAMKTASMEQCRLYILTKQAFQVEAGDKINPYGASVSGLAGVAAREYEQFPIYSMDIGEVVDYKVLCKTLGMTKKWECLSIRGEHVYVRKLKPEKPVNQRKTKFREHGVYFILGGTGGIGTELSYYLAKHYQARLIWAGRSAMVGEKEQEIRQKIRQVEALGGSVLYVQADASNYESLVNALALGEQMFGAIHGIMHSAIELKDKTLDRMDEQDFVQALVPKIQGSFLLKKAVGDRKLDFMLFFSSVVSFLYSPGQSNYTAANIFEDAFSSFENEEEDYPVKVINWGYWGETGVAASEKYHKLMAKQGIAPVLTEQGMEIIERVLVGERQQILAIDVDEEVLERIGVLGKQDETIYSAEKEKRSHSEGIISISTQSFDAKEYVKNVLSEILLLDAERIELDGTLENYGVDSLVILDLNKRFEEDFGKLPVTLLFENTTVEKLCEYFEKRAKEQSFDKGEVQETKDIDRISKVQTETIEDIAVIGMSGRFPEAENLDELWRVLKDGMDCIVEIPEERWDWHKYFSEDKRDKTGKMYSKWGGFLKGIDEFDPYFFKITPNEVYNMDPQQRLFLETVWCTLEDAGYTPENLCGKNKKRNVGVFVASMWNDYQVMTQDVFQTGGTLYNSYSYWSIANRISYHFNFNGPSIAVDTACSSSLVAVQLACESIRRGESSLAVAGGINLSIHYGKYIKLCQNGFLSSDGKCRSFGEGGDGFVPGEGVCAVLLKPLSKAKEDGDHIYAVIKGMAQNHGGKAKGFTVPNPVMQGELITEALENGNIHPRTISYIEAHGTGTSLGDPIEVSGLSNAFSKYTSELGFCSIGSLKSNIGHLEAAAGVAALAKVALMMKYGKMVQSLHSDTVNPHINFAETPFYLSHKYGNWERPVIEGKEYPRRAGISSFGAGGSNVHMIVEEYQPQESLKEEQKVIILLSAKELESLRGSIDKLIVFLMNEQESIQDGAQEVSLVDIAYTLQVGREVMDYKMAIEVASKAELLIALQNAREQEFKRVKTKKDMTEEQKEQVHCSFRNREFDILKTLWLDGYRIDWNELYNGEQEKYNRVSLPTYCFSRERFQLL